MAKHNFTCPHCGQQVKVIPQKRHSPPPRRSQFESTAPAPPAGLVKSLFWFLRGNRPAAPTTTRPADQTVKIEIWDHPSQAVKIDHLDERLTVGIITDVAQMIESGHDWTRRNLVRHTRLSENKCRVLVSEFKRLNYLDVSKNNRSTVTPPGRRFLRGILATNRPRTPTHNNTQR